MGAYPEREGRDCVRAAAAAAPRYHETKPQLAPPLNSRLSHADAAAAAAHPRRSPQPLTARPPGRPAAMQAQHQAVDAIVTRDLKEEAFIEARRMWSLESKKRKKPSNITVLGVSNKYRQLAQAVSIQHVVFVSQLV